MYKVYYLEQAIVAFYIAGIIIAIFGNTIIVPVILGFIAFFLCCIKVCYDTYKEYYKLKGE